MKTVFLSEGRNTVFHCVIVAVMSATIAKSSNRVATVLAAATLMLSGAQYAFASTGNIQTPNLSALEKTPFEKKARKVNVPGTSLTADAVKMAHLLEIDPTLEQLKTTVTASGPKPDREQMVDIMFFRQQIERRVQYASLELEEALANIDDDLSFTAMELSIFTAKNDRAVMLSNVATFLTSGTLGVLDSATGINHGPPLPNVLGITGSASAIAIPLLGLRQRKFKPLRAETKGNMLAPIFNLPYEGDGYDPIIWAYLESVPAGETGNLTRRQLLQQKWKKYRNFTTENGRDQELLKRLAEVSTNNKTVTLDLLKLRSELLVDLRSLVRQMYADLSDLNTEIMKY